MLQRINKAKAKRDPVYFAKTLLRYDVHPYQAAALRDDHPTTVLETCPAEPVAGARVFLLTRRVH